MKSAKSSPRLRVQSLESREVPAGDVTATLSNSGVLTIIGDDLANQIQLSVTPGNTTVTGVGTTVDGQAFETFTDPVNSIVIKMGDGDDSVTSAALTNFTLPANLTVDLGNAETAAIGDTLTIDTGALNDLSIGGNVSIKQGTNSANITLGGGEVVGKVAINGTTGNLSVGFDNLTVTSSAALNIVNKNGDANAPAHSLSVVDSIIGGKLGFKAGTGSMTAQVVTSNTAGLSIAASGTDNPAEFTVDVLESALVGPVILASKGAATVNFDTSPEVKAVKVTGGAADTVAVTFANNSGADSVSVSAGSASVTLPFSLTGNESLIGGNLSILGKESASLDVAGLGTSLEVGGNLAVKATAAGGDATFNASGEFVTVTGTTTVSAKDVASVQLATNLDSIFTGLFVATGGTGDDNFTGSATFNPVAGVKANFKNGANTFTLGEPGLNGVLAGGSVSYKGGSDVDTVNLTAVNLEGKLSINTGAGDDIVNILQASTIGLTTLINTSAGNDTVNVASDLVNVDGPTTFTGKTKFILGSDDDTIVLGIDGSDNAQVVFSAPSGNILVGGSGADTYNEQTANIVGELSVSSSTETV